MCFKKVNKNDPVKYCCVYKEFECAHVDGMLCDFENCDMRKNQELFNLEQEMDIPYKDRFYNSQIVK